MVLAKNRTIKNIFINEEDNRLRAGWRILIFALGFVLISQMIAFGLKAIPGAVPKPKIIRGFYMISLAAVVSLFAVYYARKFLDKKSFVSLGLKFNAKSVKDLVFGFFLSGLMAAAVYFIMLGSGLLEFNGFNWNVNTQEIDAGSGAFSFLSYMHLGSFLFMLFTCVIIGWWEELVFRGYIFQNMVEGLGLKVSIIISCLLYGAVHTGNPNAGVLSTIIIVLFGFLRLYGYLATKLLWLSVGMHIGWNFFQGTVFGYAASGFKSPTLISHSFNGPDWLTGGEFGPEGSIIIIPILGLAILAMYYWSKKAV